MDHFQLEREIFEHMRENLEGIQSTMKKMKSTLTEMKSSCDRIINYKSSGENSGVLVSRPGTSSSRSLNHDLPIWDSESEDSLPTEVESLIWDRSEKLTDEGVVYSPIWDVEPEELSHEDPTDSVYEDDSESPMWDDDLQESTPIWGNDPKDAMDELDIGDGKPTDHEVELLIWDASVDRYFTKNSLYSGSALPSQYEELAVKNEWSIFYKKIIQLEQFCYIRAFKGGTCYLITPCYWDFALLGILKKPSSDEAFGEVNRGILSLSLCQLLSRFIKITFRQFMKHFWGVAMLIGDKYILDTRYHILRILLYAFSYYTYHKVLLHFLVFSSNFVLESPNADNAVVFPSISAHSDIPSLGCSLILQGYDGNTVWKSSSDRSGVSLDYDVDKGSFLGLELQQIIHTITLPVVLHFGLNIRDFGFNMIVHDKLNQSQLLQLVIEINIAGEIPYDSKGSSPEYCKGYTVYTNFLYDGVLSFGRLGMDIIGLTCGEEDYCIKAGMTVFTRKGATYGLYFVQVSSKGVHESICDGIGSLRHETNMTTYIWKSRGNGALTLKIKFWVSGYTTSEFTDFLNVCVNSVLVLFIMVMQSVLYIMVMQSVLSIMVSDLYHIVQLQVGQTFQLWLQMNRSTSVTSLPTSLKWLASTLNFFPEEWVSKLNCSTRRSVGNGSTIYSFYDQVSMGCYYCSVIQFLYGCAFGRAHDSHFSVFWSVVVIPLHCQSLSITQTTRGYLMNTRLVQQNTNCPLGITPVSYILILAADCVSTVCFRLPYLNLQVLVLVFQCSSPVVLLTRCAGRTEVPILINFNRLLHVLSILLVTAVYELGYRITFTVVPYLFLESKCCLLAIVSVFSLFLVDSATSCGAPIHKQLAVFTEVFGNYVVLLQGIKATSTLLSKFNEYWRGAITTVTSKGYDIFSVRISYKQGLRMLEKCFKKADGLTCISMSVVMEYILSLNPAPLLTTLGTHSDTPICIRSRCKEYSSSTYAPYQVSVIVESRMIECCGVRLVGSGTPVNLQWLIAWSLTICIAKAGSRYIDTHDGLQISSFTTSKYSGKGVVQISLAYIVAAYISLPQLLSSVLPEESIVGIFLPTKWTSSSFLQSGHSHYILMDSVISEHQLTESSTVFLIVLSFKVL